MSKALILKFQGALLGTFAGDALGMPFEGWPAAKIAGQFNRVETMMEARLGAGTYTDDTEMMIGLAETLIEHARVEPDAFAERLVHNFNGDRGYGGGSLLVLRMLKEGTSWTKAAYSAFPEGSFGNGAAMRISPVGVMFSHDLARLIKEAQLSAKVTHTHPLGVEGAKLQALAIGLATRTDSGDMVDCDKFLDELAENVNEEPFTGAISSLRKSLNKHHDPRNIALALGNNVTALRSVPTSIYCFLRFNGDFKTSVSEAVSLGGDTDTIGAMTGALAGAHLGVDAIPVEWYEALENKEKGRDYVMELGQKLYGTRKQ